MAWILRTILIGLTIVITIVTIMTIVITIVTIMTTVTMYIAAPNYSDYSEHSDGVYFPTIVTIVR